MSLRLYIYCTSCVAIAALLQVVLESHVECLRTCCHMSPDEHRSPSIVLPSISKIQESVSSVASFMHEFTPSDTLRGRMQRMELSPTVISPFRPHLKRRLVTIHHQVFPHTTGGCGLGIDIMGHSQLYFRNRTFRHDIISCEVDAESCTSMYFRYT